MKKIYFALLFALLSGLLSGNKASGQCEYCQYPKICNYVNYSIVCNGQVFPVQAVICYYCTTTPNAYYVEVLEFSYPAELERLMYDPQYRNPACEDAMWDSLWANIRRKAFELCGYVRCPDRVTLFRTIPLCGEFIYGGPPGHEYIIKKFHPGSCNLRCVVEFSVCYDYNTQRFEEEIVNRTYLGECSDEAKYPWDKINNPNEPPFRIECAQLWESRDCPF
ncbi:MAG: hypothetical protein ACPLPX_09985, partial [Candidatus Kapaibacteriota bacterium]